MFGRHPIISAALSVLLVAPATACRSRAPLAPAPLAPAPLGALQPLPLLGGEGLDEISGIAPSRRRTDLFWLHQDSGNPPDLFAVDERGRLVGHARIEGTRNLDWEDIASFELDGRPYLLIADTGDNAGVRASAELVVVEEPELPSAGHLLTLEPAWVVPLRWAGGPRDSEAVTVDPLAKVVYLLTKRIVPAELHTAPLRPVTGEAVTKVVGRAAGIVQPTPAEVAAGPFAVRYGGQPTGMSMDGGGRRVAVLTYRNAYLFTRVGGETWAETFERPPELIALPLLPQAEAIGFDQAGGSVLVGTEQSTTLLRVPLR